MDMASRVLLLTYSPRDDVDLDEYHAWLRAVDNPFFNGRPTVKHYVNYRIAAPVQGDEDFTHFDILTIEGDGGPETVFGDEIIAEFARDWVRKWGKNPDPDAPDQTVNYRVSLCEAVAAPGL
jgi:hypothetical protein